MNRTQLEHIIRAAGSIAGDDDIIVIGSAAVLAQVADIPERVLTSIEADVFPKNKAHMADVIDGTIGELSPFHDTYGYYAHGVSPGTAANLPKGWCRRLRLIRNANTRGVSGWCVEIHDLVAGKYVSAREKDFRLARWLIANGNVQKMRLIARARQLPVSPARRKAVVMQVKTDFGNPSD